MIQDNAIIHGRTVGAWKQLAQEYNQPCGTPEELGDFIDRHEKADKADFFHPLRIAARQKELEAEEQDMIAIMQQLVEFTLPQHLTRSQVEFLEESLDSFENRLKAAQKMRVL